MWNQLYTCEIEKINLTSENFYKKQISFKIHVRFHVLLLPSPLVCISHYCPKPMTQKLVKIVGNYSIDAFRMLKRVTNDNFSSSACFNFENFV